MKRVTTGFEEVHTVAQRTGQNLAGSCFEQTADRSGCFGAAVKFSGPTAVIPFAKSLIGQNPQPAVKRRQYSLVIVLGGGTLQAAGNQVAALKSHHLSAANDPGFAAAVSCQIGFSARRSAARHDDNLAITHPKEFSAIIEQ